VPGLLLLIWLSPVVTPRVRGVSLQPDSQGSTIAQITAAYSTDRTVQTIDIQEGQAVVVTKGNLGTNFPAVNGPPGLISFDITGSTVGPPILNNTPGGEICSG